MFTVNETFMSETETFNFKSETKPRRDETFLQNLRDETETFQKQVSRPSRDRDVECETTSLKIWHTITDMTLFYPKYTLGCMFNSQNMCEINKSVR